MNVVVAYKDNTAKHIVCAHTRTLTLSSAVFTVDTLALHVYAYKVDAA
jgi:hypothetical protein